MSYSTHSNEQSQSAFFALTTELLLKIKAKAHTALRTLQMGRMLSTLESMSDEQLAQIGISRADIPKYAETLMAED